MALTLNHYHYPIRSADLDACRHFYTAVLGLQVGPRPEFPLPGLWLYEGDTTLFANAVVHIIDVDRNDPEGLKAYLSERGEAAQPQMLTSWSRLYALLRAALPAHCLLAGHEVSALS